ncbi:MAG: ABC transporter substrate-binding protein [Planctomycetes bacterium]|nr:ABC transporter substrate-binding protein [Planctomycetota bacterium]
MKLKRGLLFLVAIAILATGIGVQVFRSPRTIGAYRVAIVSIAEIDPIVELRSGFKSELEILPELKGRKIVYTEMNAQGDAAVSSQIADKVATDGFDLVYVLGTPLAQAIQKRAPNVLMVQGAVTDPVAAGLADSWDGSGRKYIATSDLPPEDSITSLMRSLTPDARRLGVLYNPGEANSAVVVSRLKVRLSKQNVQLVEVPLATTADAAGSVQSLAGRVDSIYVPPDNTAYAAIKVIGEFATSNSIPLFGSTTDTIASGALAAVSLDYRELGRESALLVQRVLRGEHPEKLPIQVNRAPKLVVSQSRAKQFGIDLKAVASLPNVEIRE